MTDTQWRRYTMNTISNTFRTGEPSPADLLDVMYLAEDQRPDTLRSLLGYLSRSALATGALPL